MYLLAFTQRFFPNSGSYLGYTKVQMKSIRVIQYFKLHDERKRERNEQEKQAGQRQFGRGKLQQRQRTLIEP